MTDFEKFYNDYKNNQTAESLLSLISFNLYCLKGVMESPDFKFLESKDNIIETLRNCQHQLVEVEKKLNDRKP